MQHFTDASHSPSSSFQVAPLSALSARVNPPFGLPVDTSCPLNPLPSTFSIRARTNSNDLLGTLNLFPNGSCSTDTNPAAGVWTWTQDFPSSDANVLATVNADRVTAAGGYLSFSDPASSESPLAVAVAVWAIPTLTEDYPSSRFWIRRVWPAAASEASTLDVVIPNAAGMLVRKRN